MFSKELLYDWNGINEFFFQYLNNKFYNSHLLNKFLIIITELGNIRKIPYVVIFSLTAYVIYNLLLKRYRQPSFFKEDLNKWSRIILIMGCSLLITGVIAPKLKQHFDYLRPLCNNKLKNNIHILTELGTNSITHMINKRCQNDGSFPSAHAIIIAVVSASLWSIANLVGRLLIIFFVFVIIISRIAIGVHYPADLIGGYLIGFLIYMITRLLVDKILKLKFSKVITTKS